MRVSEFLAEADRYLNRGDIILTRGQSNSYRKGAGVTKLGMHESSALGGEQPGARYGRAFLRTLTVRDPAETVPASPRLRACAVNE